MIKLKDLLNEIAWKDDTLMLSARRKIPISSSIMKKVIGDISVNSFHITDIKNVSKLKSLVGKKKSISTFNAYGAEASELKHGIGIQTKGGILVSVEGKLLASNVSDIMSQPDETGRRWVANSTFNKMFGDVLGSSAIENELSKNKIWKEKYSTLSIDQIKALTNQEKAEYIKIYIDTLTKMMIRNKDIIKKVFELAISRSDVYWNEIVLSQIKLKDALIFSDSVPMKFVWKDHPEHNTVDTYGIKFLSKNQIMNIVKKVTTGKVFWGKLSDMAKFIKKRGGNPHEAKFKIGIVK